jgi:hypothetical protein
MNKCKIILASALLFLPLITSAEKIIIEEEEEEDEVNY